MRRTGRTPIDDDAEKTEIRPLEASMPLSIMGTVSLFYYRIAGGVFQYFFFSLSEPIMTRLIP